MNKVRIVYVFTSCQNAGPVKVVYNIVSNLDFGVFEPIIITTVPECSNSILSDFLKLNIQHYFCRLSKISAVFNICSDFKKLLVSLHPDVIHSTGTFPDLAVSRVFSKRQLITLHTYLHDDLIREYGFIKGKVLEYLQMTSVKKAKKVVACSSGLSKMYEVKKGMLFDYINNGTDIRRFNYSNVGKENKATLREKLSIPKDKIIFAYAGKLIPRKNQEFLIDIFQSDIAEISDCSLLLLGDGPEYDRLVNKAFGNKRIIFTGNVINVEDYLCASDVYISSSTCEGLPNGVIEAMACGLPLILSDIDQHKAIFDISSDIGYLFISGNSADCISRIKKILTEDIEKLGQKSHEVAEQSFSAEKMSQNYQKQYLELVDSLKEKGD